MIKSEPWTRIRVSLKKTFGLKLAEARRGTMSVLVPIDVALRRTSSSHVEGLRVRSNDGVDTCAVPSEAVKPGSPTFSVPTADGAPVEVVFVSIRSSAIEELDRDAVTSDVVLFTITPSLREVLKVFNAIETSSGDQAAPRAEPTHEPTAPFRHNGASEHALQRQSAGG